MDEFWETDNNNRSDTHTGHRERIKEKIRSAGIDHLPPHEVLEYLLFFCIPRKDTNGIAHALIDRFGSLAGVLEASPAELEKVSGISTSTATFLSSLPAVARYYLKDRWSERPRLTDPYMTGEYLCDLFAGEKNEAFYVLSLDTQCRLIKTDLVYRGTINETPVYPRMVVELALKNNAAKVVLSHNHPSGGLRPSQADLMITQTIVDVMNLLSIPVEDHIIVGGGNHFSFRQKKYLVGNRVTMMKESNEAEINEDLNID